VATKTNDTRPCFQQNESGQKRRKTPPYLVEHDKGESDDIECNRKRRAQRKEFVWRR